MTTRKKLTKLVVPKIAPVRKASLRLVYFETPKLFSKIVYVVMAALIIRQTSLVKSKCLEPTMKRGPKKVKYE